MAHHVTSSAEQPRMLTAANHDIPHWLHVTNHAQDIAKLQKDH